MQVFILLLGGAIGSFLGALTYRWPHEISINDGRSICPKCKKQISWYDNIPLLSYLLLKGKCRNCDQKISVRYFVIELSTAFAFLFILESYFKIAINMPWLGRIPYSFGLAAFLTITAISIGIFIIDFEHQYIPDSLSFVGLGVVVASFLITANSSIWMYLASGLGSGIFLLLIHIATFGKGMGLGDVKLALFFGTALGFPLSLVWLFLSFIIGSIVGIILLLSKRTKLKQKIAFGPFLVVSFFIAAIFGNLILNYVWFF